MSMTEKKRLNDFIMHMGHEQSLRPRSCDLDSALLV